MSALKDYYDKDGAILWTLYWTKISLSDLEEEHTSLSNMYHRLIWI